MTEILVGFLIAAGVGLTGVGAGSLLAPVLMLFFKVPPAEAVGTALAFSAVIKLTIAPVYVIAKFLQPRRIFQNQVVDLF